MIGNFAHTCRMWILFKFTFENSTRVSSGLDPDQAQHNVGPDLGPNCLPKVTTSRENYLKCTRICNF